MQEHNIKQWKVVVFGPSLDNDSIGKGLVEMTKKKLSLAISSEQDHDPNLLSCFSCPNGSIAARWIDNDMLEQEIAYSEKKRRDFLTGTSGVLFVHVQEEESIEEAKSRLFKLIEALPRVPRVALVILTTAKHFILDQVPEGVDSFEIFKTNVDIFSMSTIATVMKSIHGLLRLSKNFDIEDIEGLSVKLIRDFAEDFLVEKFFNQVYVDLRDRKNHRKLNELVNMYNGLIDHLIMVISDQDLQDISWPIPELKRLVLDEEIPSYWNDFPYLEQVRSWISNLKLPISKPFQDLSDLDKYLSVICKGYTDFALAFSRIQVVLDKVKRKKWNLDQVPWTDIVHALIDYKLGQRSTHDPYSHQGSDMVVLYSKGKLDSFKYSKSWQKSTKSSTNIVGKENQAKIPTKSQLSQELKAELEQSLQYEKTLEDMLNNEGHQRSFKPPQEVEETEDCPHSTLNEECYQSFHFPVVSMLSPSLGLVAGSRSLQQRFDIMAKKKRPIEEDDDDNDIKPKEACEQKPKKLIKSHLVRSLYDRAQAELTSSRSWEEKLKKYL